MSDEDATRDVIERLEWADPAGDDTASTRWMQTTRRAALSGGAAGLAAVLLGACGGNGNGAAAASGSGASRVFGSQSSSRASTPTT